jgi:hypothetical protein
VSASPADNDILADALSALAAVILTRKLPRENVAAILDALRDNGATALAAVIVQELPFDLELDYTRFFQ